MKRATAFWDASALVPLCIHEAASRHAQSHLRRFSPRVSRGTSAKMGCQERHTSLFFSL